MCVYVRERERERHVGAALIQALDTRSWYFTFTSRVISLRPLFFLRVVGGGKNT